MPNLINILNQRFGLLTVVSYEHPLWKVVCDCGKEKVLPSGSLRSGCTRSCGCLRSKATAARNFRHGKAHRTPEYGVWASMIQRCSNPRVNGFHNYGGRGIKVCTRWTAFASFFADMGYRPTPLHQLDRINNDGDYEPANCRWATKEEQMKTRRQTGSFWDLDARRTWGEKGRRVRSAKARHRRSSLTVDGGS